MLKIIALIALSIVTFGCTKTSSTDMPSPAVADMGTNG
jgi:hypothetical protein